MGPQEGLQKGFKRGLKRGLKRGFKRGLEQGMLECEAHINAHHDLAGLCASLPRRVQKLLDNEGPACITDLICTNPEGSAQTLAAFRRASLVQAFQCARRHPRPGGRMVQCSLYLVPKKIDRPP